MSATVADIFKNTYKQIPKDKCALGGGKHVNLITDPTVGYCLCPEGQSIADSANPKCAPIDPKVPYEPFNSGFYREGTQCKAEEGLVTQKHPFHQNFGEAACASPAPTCSAGFEKQQLRYDGEVLDYCVRKDADGKFVSSYYPTTFLLRPPTVVPAPAPQPKTEEKTVPTWVWWVGGGIVAIVLLVIVIVVALKWMKKPAAAPATLTPATSVSSSPFTTKTPVAPAPTPAVSFGDPAAAPPAAPAPPAPPVPGPEIKGGKRGRGRGRK